MLGLRLVSFVIFGTRHGMNARMVIGRMVVFDMVIIRVAVLTAILVTVISGGVVKTAISAAVHFSMSA